MAWPFNSPRIEHERVLAAIRKAESRTTGEIRVVVARHKANEPVSSAQAYFNKFGMANSPHRNGVLIFIAPKSKNFAVIGDTGVHEKCGDVFWSDLAAAMSAHFRRGDFTAGLVHGVERAGELLAQTFPRTSADPTAGPAQENDVD
jgi:uncharacterized membrane protein